MTDFGETKELTCKNCGRRIDRVDESATGYICSWCTGSMVYQITLDEEREANEKKSTKKS